MFRAFFQILKSKICALAFGTKDVRSSALAQWEDGLLPLWKGKEEIVFSYNGSQGREKRTVTLQQVFLTRYGEYILRGHCHARGEERTFKLDAVLTMIVLNGKKYAKNVFLFDGLGVTRVMVRDAVQSALAAQRQAFAKRFSSIWQGKKRIFFRYKTENNFEATETEIQLVEVLLSKQGYPYFLAGEGSVYELYACSGIDSDIYYNDQYVQLYPFLMVELGIDGAKIGVDGLWKGQKAIEVTVESGWLSFKKKPVIHAAVVRDRLKTIFFVCATEDEERVFFIPWADVKSVYMQSKRLAPRAYLEKHLGLSLPRKDA